MKRRPRGWKKNPKVYEAYEEGGRAVGKALLHNKEREPMIWKLISGTSIWPRWYLSAFRTLYIRENPKEYRNWKRRRDRARQRLNKAAKLGEKTREQAHSDLTAHPLHKTRKDAGPDTQNPTRTDP